MKQEWKTYLRVGIAAFLVYLCIYYWDALAGLLVLLPTPPNRLHSAA